MRKVALGLLCLVLASCAPTMMWQNQEADSRSLQAVATEQGSVLTFTMTNISNKTFGMQFNYCTDADPNWEIRASNGELFSPSENSGAPERVFCNMSLTWGPLDPGKSVQIHRKTYLPSGLYTIKAWAFPILGSHLRHDRVEAPPIIVTIP